MEICWNAGGIPTDICKGKYKEKLQNFAYMIYHVGIWFKYDWLDSNSYINKIKTNTCYFYTLWVVFCQKLINLQCFCKILSLRFMLFSPQKKIGLKSRNCKLFCFLDVFLYFLSPSSCNWMDNFIRNGKGLEYMHGTRNAWVNTLKGFSFLKFLADLKFKQCYCTAEVL